MIKIRSDQIKSRKDWLGFRKKRIGGLGASIARSLNRYKAALELWLERMEMSDIDGSEASMQFPAAQCSEAVKDVPVDLGEKGLFLIQQYDVVLEQEKKLTEAKTLIENQLKDMLGAHTLGTADGRKVTWKNVTVKRFDSAELKMNEPMLYEQYRKETVSRQFSVA